ncbi:EutP/PduV family microcompartment system protein [Enterococcus sp. 2201sp1_2201st1_B8_2201SCRN_220225]
MKKIILMGAVGCGKTTLCQALGSQIKFSVTGDARFVYVTYPADWQSQ